MITILLLFERNPEGSANTQSALNCQICIVGTDNLFDKRKAQTVTAHFFATGFIHHIKWLHDSINFTLRNARALIGYLNYIVICGGERAPHGPGTGRSVGTPLLARRGGVPAGVDRRGEVLPLRLEDRQRLRRQKPLLPQLRVTAATRKKTAAMRNCRRFTDCGTIISCDYLATRPEVRTFDNLRRRFQEEGNSVQIRADFPTA